MAIYVTTKSAEPVAVVAPTISGRTARMISRFRLPVWIIAVSPQRIRCARNCCSPMACIPCTSSTGPRNWEKWTRDWLAEYRLEGTLALLTQGSGTGLSGYSNRVGFIDLTRPMADVTVW